MSDRPINRALISVYRKDGLVEFAQGLADMGVEIISTGGTAKELKKAGIKVTDVSTITGFPEIMDGRVKTLHPKIHGGLLALRENSRHLKEAKENDIELIDLVVVNFYPFQKVAQKKGLDEEEVIEQIDIGGPAMVRAAAKNFEAVTVVTSPIDYDQVLREIKGRGMTSLETRWSLAIKAFERTSRFDQAVVNFIKSRGKQVELLNLHYEKVLSLRYGENPHQKAVFFRDPHNHYPNITNAKILQGKQLSYNNILDTDAAIKLVTDFEKPTAALIKHTNPCGVASDKRIEVAFEKAYQVDPRSAFGCIVVLNYPCNRKVVEYIKQVKLFVEVIVCPKFYDDARELLKKKNNLRLIETGEMVAAPKERDIKSVGGGLLVQTADHSLITEKDLKVATKRKPTKDEVRDLLFARKVTKHVKSNSVVFVKDEMTTGIGSGQMARVDAVYIAAHKGGEKIKGSVLASDAFFPFPDGIEEAHRAGVTAIIQPGGSIRDEEVIAKADELGLAMVFTGVRSFKH